MKNLLRSSLYLFVFAMAGILFQISCSSDSFTPSSTPVGKLVYYKRLVNGTNPGAIYTCNYDGTNEAMVNITLPANVYLSGNIEDLNIRLSPDGEKVFFVAQNYTTNYKTLYSCDITGTNITVVMALNDEGIITLGGAY